MTRQWGGILYFDKDAEMLTNEIVSNSYQNDTGEAL